VRPRRCGAVGRGESRAALTLLICVALWNWRRILDFLMDREWRDWW
jgi:hypothetical protein